MNIGGWKTESMAKHYIGSTFSGKANGSKRKRDQSYYVWSAICLFPTTSDGHRSYMDT